MRQCSGAKWQPSADQGPEPRGARRRPELGDGGRQHPQGRLAAQQERIGMRGPARRLVHTLGGSRPAGLILSISGRTANYEIRTI